MKLPAAARAIAVPASDAVEAARLRDTAAFDAAAEALAAQDQERTGRVLGAVVRMLVEESHQDGVDSDDVRAVLAHCVREALAWQDDVDPQVVLVLLAGALGVYDPEGDDAPPKALAQARHGALLIASLLRARPFADYLGLAFDEIARAEHHDG
ncbi:hypothetical protein J2S43_005246 [Catenuloplanes nepalensis]|uniref:Uncharacterized protein n=1 Tax=Catenuloplanes nepalensis TaxID=587533 RepID=A0ABT9MZ60_9ACTN|nr:hypothetical protein [Catenuloplanes nepalensis]MDP9796734.1 hypothetical protein [Catenuloplanes nepalensis]